jgi:hypothetical protein
MSETPEAVREVIERRPCGFGGWLGLWAILFFILQPVLLVSVAFESHSGNVSEATFTGLLAGAGVMFLIWMWTVVRKRQPRSQLDLVGPHHPHGGRYSHSSDWPDDVHRREQCAQSGFYFRFGGACRLDARGAGGGEQDGKQYPATLVLDYRLVRVLPQIRARAEHLRSQYPSAVALI